MQNRDRVRLDVKPGHFVSPLADASGVPPAVGCQDGRGMNGMRKTKKRLDKGTEARRLARSAAAVPAATKVVPDKRKKPEKHRKKWREEGE
jgi:hypothetical protein